MLTPKVTTNIFRQIINFFYQRQKRSLFTCISTHIITGNYRILGVSVFYPCHKSVHLLVCHDGWWLNSLLKLHSPKLQYLYLHSCSNTSIASSALFILTSEFNFAHQIPLTPISRLSFR